MFDIRCLVVGWAFRTDGAAGLARAITQPLLACFFLSYFFLYSPILFAEGVCGEKARLIGNCGEPHCDEENASSQVAAYARGIDGGISSVVTVDWKSGDFDKVAICNNGPFVGCPSGYHPVSGKYGANFGCGEDTPCADGLERNELGFCVVKKTREEKMDDCARVASYGGGKSVFRHNLITGASSCMVGAALDFSSTPAAQCLQQDGTACYGNPVDVAGHEGWQCGTFNGVLTCIASAASGAAGVGKVPLGTTSTQGQIKFIEDVSDDGTNITTKKTTVTPKTETTRSYAGTGSISANERLDEGSGSVGLIHCDDGRLAVNDASCDSRKSCAAGQYLAYGVCLLVPTKVSAVTKEETKVDVEVRDKATGQIISNSSTTSSKTVSTAGGLGSGSGSSAPAGKGECDPTSSDYQECVGLLTSVSDTQAADDKAKNDAAATSAVDSMVKSVEDSVKEENGFATAPTSFFDRINSSIFTASNSACVAFSISILSFSEPIPCTLFDKFKALFGWFLYLFTTWTIFGIVKKPVER